MKKTTILVMFITIVAKVFGFLRETFLIQFFSDRAITDAFTVAYQIPNSILAVIAAALVTGLVPMISKISQYENEDSVNKFTSNVLNIFALVCILINIFVLVFPELFINIFADLDNAGNALQYAIPFVRVISFAMASIAIVQLGTGYLNVKQSFLVPAAMSIPANIMILIAMFVSSKINMPMLLAYGQFVAMALQAFVIYFFMRKVGFRQSFKIDFTDEHLRTMIVMALPLVVGSLMGQFNDILMKRQATSIYGAAGAYSYMNSSAKLQGFVSGIVVTSILNVTYPTITRNVVKGNITEVVKSINETILMLLVFILPAVVGFTLLGNGIISIVFPGYSAAEIGIIVPIFITQSFNLIGLSMRELFTRVQYAYSDMKTSVIVLFFISLGFVISLKPMIALTTAMGNPLAGIALSFSIFSIIGIVPMYYGAKKHVGKIPLGIIKKDLIKIILSSLIMGIVILVLASPIKSLLGLKVGTLATICIGGLSYLVALIALRTQFVLKLLYSFVSKK